MCCIHMAKAIAERDTNPADRQARTGLLSDRRMAGQEVPDQGAESIHRRETPIRKFPEPPVLEETRVHRCW